MVYEWDDKETECYQLYVEERKSLDEVMQHMKEVHNFNPSKRAFQTQFRRWDFPSKQNPAHKNTALVERIHELWEANTSQKDMLRILNVEGHRIKERELMRVRAKHRWLLRVPNGTKTFGGGATKGGSKGSKRKREDDEGVEGFGGMGMSLEDAKPVDVEQVFIAGNAELQQLGNESTTPQLMPMPMPMEMPGEEEEEVPGEALSPEVQEKRKQRLEKLQAESEERWATKKRRRRTRGWAGLPADPPGPPRFPSETTIDESKAFLHLDNELYRQVRDQFQAICEEAGFVKKTQAGPENWQKAKDRLKAENAHLNNEFLGPPNGVSMDSKDLALDVVCTDVTKRMRTLERRMTIAEAKNVLRINPEQSRDVRNQFYEVLKADHFTSKLEAGDEHWAQLKDQWIGQSDLLRQILVTGESEAEHAAKLKAIEVLCRDVMKRLRDDQTKRDPSRKKQINAGPGPGPAPPKIARPNPPPFSPYAPTASMVAAHTGRHTSSGQDDSRIDPNLLAAASDSTLDPTLDLTLQLQQFAAAAAGTTHNYEPNATLQQQQQQQQQHHYSSAQIYFQLHPSSPLQAEPKYWMGVVTAVSVAQLVALVQREFPAATMMKFLGLMVDGEGREQMCSIGGDDELGFYFQFVGEGKPTLSVQVATKELPFVGYAGDVIVVGG